MNQLRKIDEFKTLLANYQLSKTSLMTLSQTKLVILAAPTSMGRNTILRQLMKTGDYHYIVSDTTRQPRVNDGVLERNGNEYWFRSEDQMLEEIRRGEFLEAAIIHDQQVSGISIRELQVATNLNKIAITDAEIDGVAHAIAYKPDTIAIFVVPPSFDEWQRRLKHRGHMDPKEYKRRMQSAVQEFEASLNNDYYRFVINDSVEEAAEQVNQIAKLDINEPETQAQGRKLAQNLLIATQELLTSL